MQTTPTTIELFHLLFLRQLESKLDKKLYALKGGCNLRFFFKSIRYSEDIDFDVTTISPQTLQNKIDKILASVDFQKILKSKEIAIIQSNPVKQTETTQRWKLLLRGTHTSIPIPTKIEFSRRKMDSGAAYEAVDSELIQSYHLYPILCQHYGRNTAFLQKIAALIGRAQTQARDIFDLKWLLDHGVGFKNLTNLPKEQCLVAMNNIKQISYSDYKSQVVAFLMEAYQDFYASAKQWNTIQTTVITQLEEAAKHAAH